MIKVSLIVPAYNEEKYIAKTLASLKNQTYRNYEIIVVNNNSTDTTQEIAKQFVKNILLEPKKGYHHAVNRGVAAAQAPLMAVCDADTLYPPHWLHNVMREFEQNPDLIAVYGSVMFDDMNNAMKWLSHICFTATIFFSRLWGFHNPGGFNFVMKKDAYLAVGGYSPAIYNGVALDAELGRRLQTRGVLKFNPSIIVHTSSRRYRKGGFFAMITMYLKSWYWINFNRKPAISYEQYNQEYRD